MKRTVALAFMVASVAAVAANEDSLTLDELLAQFNWDFDTAEITTEKVDDGLYVLFGLGGNIAVSVGEQGVLIVDDMFPELMPKVHAAIKEIGGDGVDFVINTHWHFDHAQGNLALGPEGSWIVAHQQSTEMMAGDHPVNLVHWNYLQKAYPPEARPVISFEKSMRFHFNGGEIDIVHVGPAHTAGDAAVIFRKHNAVHMGDVFNNAGYPFIDADSGGDIDGMIEFCKAMYREVGPDGTVIPGHGPIVDGNAMDAYVRMLETVRDRVWTMMNEGKGLEEVIAAKPTAEFDATYGPEEVSLGFVNRVYTSLSKKNDEKSLPY